MYVRGVAYVCGVAYVFVFARTGTLNAIVADILLECRFISISVRIWHYAFFLVLFFGQVMPIFFVLKYHFALPRRRPWSA